MLACAQSGTLDDSAIANLIPSFLTLLSRKVQETNLTRLDSNETHLL